MFDVTRGAGADSDDPPNGRHTRSVAPTKRATASAGAPTTLHERHRADHDVFHLTRTLQAIVHANLQRLQPLAERYGTEPEKARENALALIRDRPEPGMLLLRDLRELHLLYAAASINWVILGQGAHAAKDAELLAVVSECHAQTLRGMKWTVTRLKTAAPQVLTS